MLQYRGPSAKIETFYVGKEAFSQICSQSNVCHHLSHLEMENVVLLYYCCLGANPSPHFGDMAQAWPVNAIFAPDHST